VTNEEKNHIQQILKLLESSTNNAEVLNQRLSSLETIIIGDGNAAGMAERIRELFTLVERRNTYFASLKDKVKELETKVDAIPNANTVDSIQQKLAAIDTAFANETTKNVATRKILRWVATTVIGAILVLAVNRIFGIVPTDLL
jgi:molybdopterin converting factor small subunit